MNTYMFMLYNGPDDFEGMGPEEMQSIVERYKAWGDRLEAEGRLVGSEKLVDDEGRVIHKRSGALTVTDGPYSETKEVIGGYFAVRAADYEEALELAKGCPHVEFGTLEIRAVDALH